MMHNFTSQEEAAAPPYLLHIYVYYIMPTSHVIIMGLGICIKWWSSSEEHRTSACDHYEIANPRNPECTNTLLKFNAEANNNNRDTSQEEYRYIERVLCPHLRVFIYACTDMGPWQR